MKFGLLVGGWMDDARRAATASGERPCADIFLLEERLKCRAFDFSWLEAKCANEPLTRTLRKRIGWSAALAVRALPELTRCNAVYCSGEDVGLPLGWLLALSRHTRIVMRMEQPEYGSTALKRGLWRILLRGTLRRMDQIFCRTEAHVEFLNRLGYEKAVFTPEATDTDFWERSLPSEKGDSEADFAAGQRILSAGLEERDYPTLIQAVESTEWQLIIAAGSPWSKFSFTSDAPPPNVTVAKFAQKELREQYKRADVVVLCVNPTHRACGMNVVLEAWAMGVPVIATNTSGLRSYLIDGDNALLVPPKNPDALQNTLEKLRSDRKLSHKLAENGKRCIASWGNLESYVGIIESALRAPSSVSCVKSPASISSDHGY